MSDSQDPITLASPTVVAEIASGLGGRIQRLTDRQSGRELLLQRETSAKPEEGFLASSTGGWDELFPNDAPWRGHPDHGRIWSTAFEVASASDESCVLRGEVAEPRLTIERQYRLLGNGRRGIRSEISVTANADTGPFLWATHIMLAVEPGWVVEGLKTGGFEVDFEVPGRFGDHPVTLQQGEQAVVVPEAGAGFAELLYIPGTDLAEVVAPDGGARTRVRWEREWLPWLWTCVISGEAGIDLSLVLEPCTSRPFRLDEAIANGTAASLLTGESARWWVELESCDLDSDADDILDAALGNRDPSL